MSKKEEIKNEEVEQETVTQEASENTTDEQKTVETPQPVVENIDFKDKYMRIYAEFDNFRRRTAKEKIELINNASGDVIKNILPVLDDFERAIKANESSEDPQALKEGVQLIQGKLVGLLEQKGLKPMNSIETTFDTEYHEAITNIPAPTKELKGKVVDVVEKGYFLNDKVLRYAKVVVGQ